jgi:hypothetical protein
MFRSRKPKTEFVNTGDAYVKHWANSAYEIELLGNRLDAVRSAKKRAKRNSWAKKHWTQAEAIILRKWKMTVRLKDVGMIQKGKKDPFRPTVSYDWWENAEEVPMTFPLFDSFSRMLQDKFGNTNLDRAWEMARNESLQKARQGLA